MSGEDGDDWGMCVECRQMHCPEQPYGGHRGRGGEERKSGRPQGDMTKNHGERDEGMWTDLGNHHQTGCKPTAVVLSCGSLMCHLRHKED